MPNGDYTHVSAISIHAPHEGCDGDAEVCSHISDLFQSTHPMRGATTKWRVNKTMLQISIHAPHEGCDAEQNTLV